jgi:septum formation protein
MAYDRPMSGASQNTQAEALVLASASPRRHDLLNLAGVPHRVLTSQIDERREPNETPEGYTRRVARQKANDVAGRCPDGTWVLAADTTVVVEGQVLGKPADAQDGKRMLNLLAGRSHRVLTAVSLMRAGKELADSFLSETQVTLRPLAADWIAGYVQTGEPLDKAGAYGIQGQGAILVQSISGSYTNVVGLPLCETVDMLERAGIFRPFDGGRR